MFIGYLLAKFNEKEEKVPKLKDLFKFCKGIYSIELFEKTELLILQLLEWNLKTISPLQFVQFYISKGIIFSTDKSFLRAIDGKLLRFLRKYSEFFLDLALQEYTFNKYSSHILACAAIAGARKAIGVIPIWNEELIEFTQLEFWTIKPCFDQLYT